MIKVRHLKGVQLANGSIAADELMSEPVMMSIAELSAKLHSLDTDGEWTIKILQEQAKNFDNDIVILLIRDARDPEIFHTWLAPASRMELQEGVKAEEGLKSDENALLARNPRKLN